MSWRWTWTSFIWHSRQPIMEAISKFWHFLLFWLFGLLPQLSHLHHPYFRPQVLSWVLHGLLSFTWTFCGNRELVLIKYFMIFCYVFFSFEKFKTRIKADQVSHTLPSARIEKNFLELVWILLHGLDKWNPPWERSFEGHRDSQFRLKAAWAVPLCSIWGRDTHDRASTLKPASALGMLEKPQN